MKVDLFRNKASDWDARPTSVQISDGVFAAIEANVPLDASMTVMDFGAGTGLLAARVAEHVEHVLAVDVSPAMLAELAQKPELTGKVEAFCQDIVVSPLERQVDVIVSAMSMHHVEDTRALARSLFAHLLPGGRVALADLDTEDGTFHPEDVEGVFHHGFDRDALGEILAEAGFVGVRFVTACEVEKNDRTYPIFLALARRPKTS